MLNLPSTSNIDLKYQISNNPILYFASTECWEVVQWMKGMDAWMDRQAGGRLHWKTTHLRRMLSGVASMSRSSISITACCDCSRADSVLSSAVLKYPRITFSSEDTFTYSSIQMDTCTWLHTDMNHLVTLCNVLTVPVGFTHNPTCTCLLHKLFLAIHCIHHNDSQLQVFRQPHQHRKCHI